MRDFAQTFAAIIVLVGLLGVAVLYFVIIYPERCRAYVEPVYRVGAKVKVLEQAISIFVSDEGRLPPGLSELMPKYTREGPLLDPWMNEVVYQMTSDDKYRLGSFGADGALGGVGMSRDIFSEKDRDKAVEEITKPIFGCAVEAT